MDNAEAIKELEFLKIAAQIDAKPEHINIEALDYAIEKLESERTGYVEAKKYAHLGYDVQGQKCVFKPDEAVIQIHPPEDQYVNNKANCLHLWRCRYKETILPPSCFVGIRKGQTTEELMKEIKAAYELAGEKYD